MAFFNVLKPWAVLSPEKTRAAAADLARCVARLRSSSGQAPAPAPKVLDAEGPAPGDSVPVIVLNAAAEDTAAFAENGYNWRAGADRVEIFGDSPLGLRRGVYDFLAALGFAWPDLNEEKIPTLNENGNYLLKDRSANRPADTDPAARRRLFVTAAEKPRGGRVEWAARNGYDAVVLPLGGSAANTARALAIAGEWNLEAERGGAELSLLVPRGAFFLHRECFRMENGRRRMKGLFCPTNPGTLEIIRREAEKLFGRALAAVSASPCPAVHLYPAETETAWCNCPACRAFPAAEQYRMAVNTAADVLAAAAPAARLFCEKLPGLPENAIALRANVIEIPLTDRR